MSKRKKEQDIVVTLPKGDDALYEAAKNLAVKMLNIDSDPDIISVFSIARAHGYKTSSKLWTDELEALKQVLIGIDEQKAAAELAAKQRAAETTAAS